MVNLGSFENEYEYCESSPDRIRYHLAVEADVQWIGWNLARPAGLSIAGAKEE
jgi:hypothetical protein